MRASILVLAALVAVQIAAQAQINAEVRPHIGVYLPLGDQRDIFKSSVMTGAQLAVQACDVTHFVGTFAFAGPSFRAKLAQPGHAHVYQGDLGVEVGRDMAMSNGWSFRPFLGAGAGVRAYDYTNAEPTKRYATAFGAGGAEFRRDRIALRVEARDYLTRFKGIRSTENPSTRNELALSAGIVLHAR